MRQDRDRRGDRDGGGYAPRNFAPVKVGDEFTVTIEAVGEKGDGIAKKDGFVLFVPNTKQGDTVKIRVTRVLRKVGFAEVVGGSESEGQQKEENYDDQPVEAEPSGESSSQSEEKYDDAEDSEDFGEEGDGSQ